VWVKGTEEQPENIYQLSRKYFSTVYSVRNYSIINEILQKYEIVIAKYITIKKNINTNHRNDFVPKVCPPNCRILAKKTFDTFLCFSILLTVPGALSLR